ncbi:MAG: hypothetical protein JW934_09620 [Anaerolineae bacterium]|nr:hypothetical protein [Anaerolineae bacterium]
MTQPSMARLSINRASQMASSWPLNTTTLKSGCRSCHSQQVPDHLRAVNPTTLVFEFCLTILYLTDPGNYQRHKGQYRFRESIAQKPAC